MKKRNFQQYTNYVCIILVIVFLLLNRETIFILNAKQIFLILIPFCFIHFFRVIRQYMILMKNKIHIKELTKSYLLSSLLNTILPYKLGEIYKIYLYGGLIKDYKKSVIAVIIDKFFDAFVLLIIFSIVDIKKGQGLSYITILLLLIECVIFIIYFSFSKTYKFLNQYLIINKHNKITIKCLKILEEANELYLEVKNMIKCREILLIILTVLSWIMEIFFVYIIKFIKYNDFSFTNFMEYINNSFFGFQNDLSNYYILATVVLIVIFMIFLGIRKVLKNLKRGYKYEKNSSSL